MSDLFRGVGGNIQNPHTMTTDDVLEEGLSEREAKDKAKESRRIVARPRKSV